jgi:predicted ABC-type transport system involved in lysophospholipase L1 biosynthesis ATPase subunit
MIEIRDLVMRLPSGDRILTVLDGITLEVPARQFLAIAGPSGSGKSTLLGLLAGLDQPTAGSIRIDGVELGRLDEDALARLRREKIGYVFQSFHLIPTLTALENVAVPLELGGAADALARARALLKEVGLADRPITTRRSSREASSSAWRSPAPSQTGRRSSWPTSRPGTWIRRPAPRSSCRVRAGSCVTRP